MTNLIKIQWLIQTKLIRKAQLTVTNIKIIIRMSFLIYIYIYIYIYNKKKKDMKCTYKVTLWHVRATNVAVEKKLILKKTVHVCTCSPTHPACNARAPYCHLWPALLHKIFPQWPINDKILFKKKKKYWKCNVGSDFPYKVCLKHFSLQTELSEIWSKMYIGIHISIHYSCQILKKTWTFSTNFRKLLKYQNS